jgi:hypothetical protein
MDDETRATLAHVCGIVSELGLVAGATIASVQRRLHVGVADAMRLLAIREGLASLDPPQTPPQEER